MPSVAYEGHDLAALSDMPNYYSRIFEVFGPCIRGHVVEYGAGIGTVSDRLLPLADRLTVVEPSPNLAVALKSRFANDPRVEVREDTLEDHAPRLASESVDTVVMINVLEHIDDDPGALSQLLRILKPGGMLLIFVPALEALMSKLDRHHGHFRRYHKPDLTEKIVKAGGNVLTCRYFDLVGVLPWFLLNKLMGITTFNRSMVKFNDRVIVPLSRILEAVPPPLGKNLILVARKEAQLVVLDSPPLQPNDAILLPAEMTAASSQ